ncbi:hypothetical protein [Saccharopolyspora shandongensis]|uniref:hypothetical protein n=1 Tax=Saccharopolyspora shandongensis TaxID=418495 RepID=UPI0033C00B13
MDNFSRHLTIRTITCINGGSGPGDGCRHLTSFAVDFWQLLGSSDKAPITDTMAEDHRADVGDRETALSPQLFRRQL